MISRPSLSRCSNFNPIALAAGQTLEIRRMPAMVVVDMDGKIRYRHYGESMSDIPSDEEILSLLDELNKE